MVFESAPKCISEINSGNLKIKPVMSLFFVPNLIKSER